MCLKVTGKRAQKRKAIAAKINRRGRNSGCLLIFFRFSIENPSTEADLLPILLCGYVEVLPEIDDLRLRRNLNLRLFCIGTNS